MTEKATTPNFCLQSIPYGLYCRVETLKV